MAEAARVVEAMGADIVDVNMGCPVPKIAKHQAGCSLMRDPAHAGKIVEAMTQAVRIPVTVKMRKGWDDTDLSAPDVARRVEDAGASAIAIHGRTAKQSYAGHADWDFVAEVARAVRIPVFGSGDCIEPEQVVAKLESRVSGVFVGRGVLRNPWILAQARDLIEGRAPRRCRSRSGDSSCSITFSCCSTTPARSVKGSATSRRARYRRARCRPAVANGG